MIILLCGQEARGSVLVQEAASGLEEAVGAAAQVAHVAPVSSLPTAPAPEPVFITATTAELTAALDTAAADQHSAHGKTGDTPNSPTAIVPMTAGRDLHLITAAGQAAHWWSSNHADHPLCVAAAPGDATKCVAALRANMRKHPADHYVVASCTIDPFSDAELFRQARLAWQYGNAEVSVAFDGAEPSIDVACARARQLGSTQPVVLRADLRAGCEPGAEPAGSHAASVSQIALWTPSALRVLLVQTISQARHLALAHGDDGIDAAFFADHEHGYAHSHGEDEGADAAHSHPHSHAHPHNDSHSHTHSHALSHGHSHSHTHGHAHGHAHAHDHSRAQSHEHSHTPTRPELHSHPDDHHDRRHEHEHDHADSSHSHTHPPTNPPTDNPGGHHVG